MGYQLVGQNAREDKKVRAGWSELLVLGMVTPPFIGNPGILIMGPYKPLGLMAGLNGSLDPSTYVYTWNPNGPCFDWKRPCFGGLTFKNRDHLGSRYIYIYIYLSSLTGFCPLVPFT